MISQIEAADPRLAQAPGEPLLLVVERDIAKALGQAAAGVLAGGRPVVSLDSIHVEQNDYIDMGRPLMDGLVGGGGGRGGVKPVFFGVGGGGA